MSMEVKKFKDMKYIVRYPNDFAENKKYPVIIFLHGAGSRGYNIKALEENPYFRETAVHNIPAVTFAPQCFANSWFDVFGLLQEFIQTVIKHPYVDRRRVSLIGASMGAYAVWQMAMSHPELFAAIVPICGGGMYWNAARLKEMPIWAFHGSEDPTVYPEESIKMVERVNRCGGNAKLTICDGVKHDSWLNAYRSSEVFEWMLSQENIKILNGEQEFQGAEEFG